MTEPDLSQLLDCVAHVHFVLDSEWRFVYLNRAGDDFLRRIGRRHHELIGRQLWEEFPQLVGSRFEAECRRALERQVALESEEFWPSLGRWFSLFACPSSAGLSIFLRDVTDRRRSIEEERAGLVVRERAARAEAETTSRAKDEFIAVLSHELRDPLSAILGWANGLRRGVFNAAMAARALEAIERNARLQARLIDDLLDLSRVVAGKLHVELRPVNLLDVIHGALEALSLRAKEKGIDLACVADPPGCTVLGDADKLEQVVRNLLANAVKFTRTGGRVEVRLECTAVEALLTVRDTGQGIHPKFLPHVFELFRQIESPATPLHGGLGLGLAIVRRLVELHGGTVRAESEGEGRGSTFTVTLPLAPGSAPAGPSEVR